MDKKSKGYWHRVVYDLDREEPAWPLYLCLIIAGLTVLVLSLTGVIH